MKQNDIFEKEFDGNVYRFQLTELEPRWAVIRVLDTPAQINIKKDCKVFVYAPSAPGNHIPFRRIWGNFNVGDTLVCKTKAEHIEELAYRENDGWVTTQKGDKMIEELSADIYKRIKDWHFSVQWVSSNTSLKRDEAEELVAKMNVALRPHTTDRYLPTIVRWVGYGEIDPDNETDLERMRNLIESFHDHERKRTKENVASVGYKVEFDDNGFKRRNVDGTEIRLERMEETEEALRSWSNV